MKILDVVLHLPHAARRYVLRSLLERQGSRFVTVEFLKVDGSLRTMLIQHAATKYRVKGDLAPLSRQLAAATRAVNHPNLFNTYDVDRDDIRSIDLDRVLTVRSRGRTLFALDQYEVEALI